MVFLIFEVFSLKLGYCKVSGMVFYITKTYLHRLKNCQNFEFFVKLFFVNHHIIKPLR